MSRLLEILGRAIIIDTADLIWHWFGAVNLLNDDGNSTQYQQLDRVIELLGQSKLTAAEEQLRLYLFENPSCPYGRLAATAIALSKNEIQSAVEELNSVYMRQPNNTMALYALGHCYERLGQEAQAVEFYQDCLKFKNYLQLPRQRLAAVYFKNGQLEKTINEYEQLKLEYPDDISTLVTLGHLYIAVDKYENAAETFNNAILMHPDNFHATEQDAVQLIEQGMLQEAAEKLEDMLAENPERADLIAQYADVLGMLGATTEAIFHYEQALRICPDFLEATIKLGTQYLQLSADHLAARQFNRAAEINDQIVDAYIGFAIAQKQAGNQSEALSALSLAAAIQPNSALLLAETATLQFRVTLGAGNQCQSNTDFPNLIEAVICAHQSQLAERPNNPDLHYRLGVLLMSIGKLGSAIDAFRAALGINPTYTRARNKLAVCLFETGQKDMALDALTGPDCLDHDTLDLHYKVALLYCDRIKFASSLINLERHLEHNFTCTDATVNVSIVLQNLGLLDRAVAMWDNLSDTTNQAISAG